MNLLAWELIFYRLEIRSVIALFNTCQNLQSISKRESLWSYLMRRDFPEHFLLSNPLEHKSWYKDLYQFGAFFVVESFLPLLPFKPLYIARKVALSEIIVSTVRGRVSKNNFVRYPGQKYVTVLNNNMLSREQCIFLSNCESDIFNVYKFLGIQIVFLHTNLQLNWIAMKKLKQWDESRFNALLVWISDHFEVEKCEYLDAGVSFTGKLRKGHTLNPDSPGLSENLQLDSTRYDFRGNVFSNASRAIHKPRKIHLYSYSIRAYFPSVNNENIPDWRLKK